ncbi:hypothetical protein SELMODRAFT_449110 [Selaginella moellendorffii]|uniref:HMA domain-containing protein n=1 Tax=Selaginella moellendorffii TaxID=88036 RepID=D8TCN4_SELML|nr:heavy metal-associated isoprenylated plant protein 43 [Selaginella moellendorffii]EFJ05533.1 hypothetical protein SELMODRAFT_449110 [Selaginella moellendorffii]|eukprot:XP_002993348.1 heavy metal-associated isoprenylated plant protein 43 [Selaginella moellendorffii]
MRKLTLKVFMSCGKCKDKLVKQLSEVPGVSKVELVDGSTLIITGDFKANEVLEASGKRRKCLAVESMEELPDPPPPPPPEPEQPSAPPEPEPAPPEPPKPEEEPPKPAEEPPKEEPPPPPPTQVICVDTWPSEFAKIGKLPGGIIVLVKNLILCPHNNQVSDCDSCC